MKRFTGLIAFFALTLVIYAEDSGLYAVILNGAGRNFPLFSLTDEYAINEFRFTSQNPDELIENIHKAKLLYVGQYSEGFTIITGNKKFSDAVRFFLKNGGCIFFDFSSTSRSYDRFLKSISVENPAGTFSGGYYKSEISRENADMKIFNIPNKISADFRCYGYWEKWSEKQFAPLRDSANLESRAAMIIQENVMGKGRVIFSQCPEIFRKPAGFTENILSYIYDSDLTKHRKNRIMQKGGPGEPVDY